MFTNNTSLTTDIKLLQNPVSNAIPLQVTVSSALELHFSITDLSGKEISTQDIKINTGVTMVSVLLPGSTPKGIYLLNVQSDKQYKTIRFMIR